MSKKILASPKENPEEPPKNIIANLKLSSEDSPANNPEEQWDTFLIKFFYYLLKNTSSKESSEESLSQITADNLSEERKLIVLKDHLFEIKTILKSKTIGLEGQLGAGKTTFVKRLTSFLGVQRDKVTSPSYNIQSIYEIEGLNIEHWDLYRLSYLPEELMEPSRNLRLIEWSNLIPDEISLIDYKVLIHLRASGLSNNVNLSRFVELIKT